MKIIFIVQGEGRGHMTQALALEQILVNAGHEVTDIAIGTSNRREIPKFFRDKTSARIQPIESPNFYYDKGSKSINIRKTVILNIFRIPIFLKGLGKIHHLKRQANPDVIINFYDILGGFYFLLFRPNVRRLSIAHQYLALHPEFPFAKGYATQKWAYQLNNRLTSFYVNKRIALSFRELRSTNNKLSIVPPLLRNEVLELSPTNGDHILAYVVNKGYGEEIIKWHSKNKKIKLHCFWDNTEFPDEWSPSKNLVFHHINDQKFLKLMASCAGYASTAGFESICEAMYLGKSVLMVPVKGQYEQACNAKDGLLAGAGISEKNFKIDKLLTFITKKHQGNREYKNWLNGYENVFLKEIEAYEPMQLSLKEKFRNLSALPMISNR